MRLLASLLLLPLAASQEMNEPMRTGGMGTRCGCARAFSPVCGSDGVTYDNECAMRCEMKQLDVAYKGTCCPLNDCPLHVDEVCDSDGDTHLNACVFELVKCLRSRIDGRHITIARQGACPIANGGCFESCARDVIGEVCDSLARTHATYCE